MSIFAGYVSLFIPVVVICVFSLRYFSLEFIYDERSAFFNASFMPNVVLTVVLASIICFVVYQITRPFDKVISRIRSGGSTATPEETVQCLSCYKKLNITTICANLVGFVIGQLFMLILGWIRGNDFYLSRSLLILFQATSFGAISAITTMYGVDYRLAPMRELLKVRSLEDYAKQRSTDITQTLTIVFIVTFLFLTVNLLCVPYGIFFNLKHGIHLPDDVFRYAMHKALLSIVITLPFCYLPIHFCLKGTRVRIKAATNLIQDITKKGDLHSRIDISMLDDFGTLTGSINKLMNEFASLFSAIQEGTAEVSTSAQNISQATTTASSALEGISDSFNNLNNVSTEQERLVTHAEENVNSLASDASTVKKHVLEQAASIQQTSASITEMSGNINSVAQIAKKAEEVSEALSQTSQLGNEAVTKAVASMDEIQIASKQVQEMVRVIQQIAQQTNLLSMNAAIEAAHAGTFGQGFAVVANEVRSLANSSAQSTQKIQQYIKVMIEKINAGAEAINTAGNSFRTIADNVTQNGELVRTISSAMEEQRSGAEETMKSTQDVVSAIQSIKELAEKESSNAESVNSYMQGVVKSSRNSVSTVLDSSITAANLKDSIAKVDELAASNKATVSRMQELVNKYAI